MGVATVFNSLILGGWVTKVLKNCDKKQGGGRVGDNNFLTFYASGSTKRCHLKTAFWVIFSIRTCKVSYFIDIFTDLKAL